MKRSLFIILALIVSFGLFAESETYLSLNAGFGKIGISKNDYYYASSKTEKDKINFDLSLNGGGLAFQSYTFWNKGNVGLFTKLPVAFGFYGFEDSKTTYLNYGTDAKQHSFFINLSPTIGVGFRKKISENWLFLSGVGSGLKFDFVFYLNNANSTSKTKKEKKHKIEFNILNNLGFKYIISEKLSFDMGVDTTLAFARYSVFPQTDYTTTPHTTTTTKEWQDGFFSINSSLFLGVSFLLNR